MKRKTKRLLGVFGLAVVIAMTAVACALPTPEAYAEDVNTSDSMTIKVTVAGPGSKMTLVKPVNGEVVKSNIVPVSYTFQRMKSIATNLSCTGTDGNLIEKVIDPYEVPEAEADSGTRSFDLDLNKWGVQADASCRVYLTGKSIDGKDVRDEGVAFEYRAIKVDMGDKDDEEGKPITDEKGDPEVTIGISDEVYSLLLQVYDASGNAIFAQNGVEEPILVSRDMFNLENNTYTLNLPMSKYGAKSGWYEFVAIAYGQDGKEVVSMNVYRFYYDAVTPNVPGTGTVMENLNISRADYVITGLIAFGAVAAFGIYLVARKSRR